MSEVIENSYEEHIEEQNTDLLEDIFDIDFEQEIEEEEQQYLENLIPRLYEMISNYGLEGKGVIQEIVLDEIVEQEFENLPLFLGLEIEQKLEDSLEDIVTDDQFLKIKNREDSGEFFDRYLHDEVVNDLVMSLLGRDRFTEGKDEVFIKTRPAKIPKDSIKAIGDILISRFNKTEFLSAKEDIEQANLIMLAYSIIFEILLDIPYEICDTKKTVDILGMVVIKLSNSIGLSQDFRKELMETIAQSYSAEMKRREQEAINNND